MTNPYLCSSPYCSIGGLSLYLQKQPALEGLIKYAGLQIQQKAGLYHFDYL